MLQQIGILQLTQHLDDAVQGFKAGLAASGLEISYQYLNADGKVVSLPALARKLEDLGANLIFACSTPSAQAAVALAADIPVVFTPVFDPVGAGLAASLAAPSGKATGMAGMVPADAKLDFISKIVPRARNIGLLYDTGDTNSLLEVNCFKAAASGRYHLTELTISTPESLSMLNELLSPPLEVLFIPSGKVIEENFATVAYYADLAQIPVIAANTAAVQAGALGALVADHWQLGYSCATQAKKFSEELPPEQSRLASWNDPTFF